jgi:acyl carrier protein
MNAPSEADIIQDLAEILRNFQGREYSDEIGPRTLFFGELGFASIDAVVLGEMLEERYGRKFPYGEFLASMRDSQVQDIEIGQLAEFLLRHMNQ